MSRFNKSKRKRKSKSRIVKKRRFTNPEHLIFLFKKVGFLFGSIVLILWFGAWFFMSDASSNTYNWGQEKFYNMTANSGFVLENLNVKGRFNTTPQVIKNAVKISKNDPIFEFDASATKKRLLQHEWIEDVAVKRQLPNTISINIQERVPMAIWKEDKKLFLIDQSGIQITDKNIMRFKDLVVIMGESAPLNAPKLFSYFIALPNIFNLIETANFISNRRWDVSLKNGTLIKLPENNVPLALSALKKMHEEDNVLQKQLTYIDLRNLERITIKNKPGKLEEYKVLNSGNLNGGDNI